MSANMLLAGGVVEPIVAVLIGEVSGVWRPPAMQVIFLDWRVAALEVNEAEQPAII